MFNATVGATMLCFSLLLQSAPYAWAACSSCVPNQCAGCDDNPEAFPKALPRQEVFVPPSAPADVVAKAAFDVLDTHCARCHQNGKLIGRSKPAKGFGNILDLRALADNPKYITPGDADHSMVYKMIIRRECPADVFQDGSLDHPVPDDKDMQSLRAWINSLGRPGVNGI